MAQIRHKKICNDFCSFLLMCSTHTHTHANSNVVEAKIICRYNMWIKAWAASLAAAKSVHIKNERHSKDMYTQQMVCYSCKNLSEWNVVRPSPYSYKMRAKWWKKNQTRKFTSHRQRQTYRQSERERVAARSLTHRGVSVNNDVWTFSIEKLTHGIEGMFNCVVFAVCH